MAEANLADPKLYNGWIHNVTNSNESVLIKQSIGSGNHQSFAPSLDNTFYQVSQPFNEMLSNDMIYPNPSAEHNSSKLTRNNSGEETTSDQHFASKMKNLSINNALTNDALSQEQFLKFKNIVIKGCESAEHLAYFHRNRPCFKKINCLCARLKQDVDRADSVLANINSQGVPWAVKDFIFVFTRIVSAWNIIKDYVYNNSDGMRTIKSAISDRLVVSFLKWQEVTADFVEDLTKSFDGLQELTLSQTRNSECQKNAEQNSNEQKTFISDTESFESCKMAVTKDCTTERAGSDHSSDSSIGYPHFNVKQLSIGSDRKFEYIKTGIYKCTVAKNSNHLNHLNGNGVHRVTTMANEYLKCQNATTDDAKKSYFTNILSGIPNPVRNTTTSEACHRSTSSPETFAKNPADTNQDPVKMNFRKNAKSELLQKVCFIEESKFFFSSQFTKNYFPDFLKIVPEFVDLRSIIMKSEMEVLSSIYDVVQQIRQIFFSAKRYLQERPHELLAACVAIFEREFENLLLRELADHDFKCLTGYDF